MNDREQFEAWYVENVFDLQSDPVGSRLCGLQWKAWQAARATPAQPVPCFEEQWSKGDDIVCTDSLPIAGINVQSKHGHIHGNAIEFFAEKLEVAQDRRDKVLSLLSEAAALAEQVPRSDVGAALKDKLLTEVNKIQRYDESNGEGGGVSECPEGAFVRISHARNAIKRVLKAAAPIATELKSEDATTKPTGEQQP
jgi:hypothetical protein